MKYKAVPIIMLVALVAALVVPSFSFAQDNKTKPEQRKKNKKSP